MPRVISVSEFIDPDYSWIARKNRLSQLNAMADGSIFSESFLLFDVEEVLVCVNGQFTAGSLIACDDSTVVQLKR